MKNFLRQTTTVQKQKWFLTAFLFAALGSNYYFQASSLDKGRFEMSSEKEVSKVEGKAAQEPCADCDKVQLTQTEYKNLKALAAKVEALEAEKVKKETAQKETEKKVETAAEKRERQKEEKAAKDQAKKDKESEAKTARNEEFADKMEDAASTCAGDVECSTSKMISLLDHYTGKNKIDASVVTKAFTQYIAKDLKAALKNPASAEATLQSLQELGLDIPTDYRFLKEKTVDLIKNDALIKGIEVNRNFQMADMLTKAKKPVEASQYLASAFQGRDELTQSSNLMYQTTIQALQEASDSTTIEYIKRTYLPDMTKMLSNISNVSGLQNVMTTSTSVSTTLNQPNQIGGSTRGNSRLDTSIANPLNTSTTNVDQKMQQQNLLNGVQFGNTTSQKRINRGAVQ